MRFAFARVSALIVTAAIAGAASAQTVETAPKPAEQAPTKGQVPGYATIPQIRKLNQVPPDVAPAKDAAVEKQPASMPPASAPADEAKLPAPKEPVKDAAAAAQPEKTVAKKVAPPPKPQPTVVISVNLTKQSMAVGENGHSLYTWPISSGRSGYDTPTGTFRPQWMAKMWHSRKYDDAPMPNSIFFTGGFAIHATAAYSQLGRPASHGCVRLSPTNAATLFKMVQRHGMEATKIVVHGAARYESPVARNEPRTSPRLAPVRYVARSSSSGLDAIFGGEPRRIVYGSSPAVVRAPARPAYVVLQNGRMLRIR